MTQWLYGSMQDSTDYLFDTEQRCRNYSQTWSVKPESLVPKDSFVQVPAVRFVFRDLGEWHLETMLDFHEIFVPLDSRMHKQNEVEGISKNVDVASCFFIQMDNLNLAVYDQKNQVSIGCSKHRILPYPSIMNISLHPHPPKNTKQKQLLIHRYIAFW